MTTVLEDARREFEVAVQTNGELSDAQRRRVEAIVSWNVDKLDRIEEAYAAKIRLAIKDVLHQ